LFVALLDEAVAQPLLRTFRRWARVQTSAWVRVGAAPHARTRAGRAPRRPRDARASESGAPRARAVPLAA